MLLGKAVAVLETLYPLRYAEDWDEPGLIVGDPLDEVRRVAVAVDPTTEVVDEALARHVDLLICHHPLFFRAVHQVAATGFRGAIVARLYRGHCALWVGHTNVDAAYRGVGQAAADTFGLVDHRPLVDEPSEQGDHRIGLGRVGRLDEPVGLQEFARRVAAALPHTELGVQVAGDLSMPVSTVAVVPGSGDSLFDEVRQTGVDVYVTSDLRHHPATDAMQQAAYASCLALDHAGGPDQTGRPSPGALTPRPALINTPHSAIESLWTSTYALTDIPRALQAATGERPEVSRIAINTDPWNMTLR